MNSSVYINTKFLYKNIKKRKKKTAVKQQLMLSWENEK